MPEEKRPRTIKTMHSLGHAIIEENIKETVLSADFRVIEEEDIRKILFVDAALRVNESESDGGAALEDRIKGKTKLSDKCLRISGEYEKLLRSCNCIDFDDQILMACKLLRDSPRIRARWQARSKHLLVDEYQDINSAQFELICLLSEATREGLFVVGDDDQSIYRFRGGSPEFIRQFVVHFGSNAKVIQMKTSRRCKRNILSAANALVEQHDSGRVPKTSPEFIEQEPGDVFIHDCPSDDREAEIIAAIIKDEINATGKEARGAFILIPNRHYAMKLEIALTSSGIGYSVRLGESSPIQKLLLTRDWAEQTAENLLTRQVMHLVIESGQCKIPSRKSKIAPKVALREASLKAIAGMWDRVLLPGESLFNVLEDVSKNSPECKDLFEKMSVIRNAYEADLGEFLKAVSCYVKPWPGKAAFFREMENIEQSKRRPAPVGKFQVRIMSFQSSKGLEANSVFVIGLEEGKFPTDSSPEVVAEEARLVFVAMTRAQDKLHLFHSRKRTSSISLSSKSHQLTQSSFLTGLVIPKDKRIYHPSKS